MSYGGTVRFEEGLPGFIGSLESCPPESYKTLKSQKWTDCVAFIETVRSGKGYSRYH